MTTGRSCFLGRGAVCVIALVTVGTLSAIGSGRVAAETGDGELESLAGILRPAGP